MSTSSSEPGAISSRKAGIVAALSVLALTGCTTGSPRPWPAEAAASLDVCWPPPPAAARIAYVGDLYGPADLGARRGWWRTLTGWITGGDDLLSPWARPSAVAVDENGDVAVTDLAGQVDLVTRNERFHRRWRSFGTNQLEAPVAVAFASNRLFIADAALGRVFAVDRRGRLQFELAEGLDRPTGLAVAGDHLFVVDAGATSILRFDLDGRLLGRFGQAGAGAGELNRPTHVAVEADRIYVTDALNARVQVFDFEGRHVRTVGRRGDGTGQFNRPKGLALGPHRELFVADALFETVQLFDETGRFLMNFGSPGSGPGEFWLPTGVATAHDGTVYVADSFNERVQILRLVGGSAHD